MPHLKVSNLGPIKEADVHFGSLTVFVGPQATGKSILLQLHKLLVDTAYIKKQFLRAGVDWTGDFSAFLDVYFGEGMRSLWEGETRIILNETSIDLKKRISDKQSARKESMFFIPAQRVLALRDGWPSAFNYYDASIPFTLREFSEHLRLLMSDFGGGGDTLSGALPAEIGFSRPAPGAYFPRFRAEGRYGARSKAVGAN